MWGLLPEPVFTHGQLYVCASRSSSALGLRFWLGDPIDGHGYHADQKSGRALPYTHNVVFPAVLSLISATDTKEPCADLALPSASCPPERGDGANDPEYVELSEMEQRALHATLYRAQTAAPVETGAADEALETHASALVPSDA